MKFFLGIVGSIILLIMLVFGVSYLTLGHFKFFAPKHENVRREVFENTKSYIHGKTQDLAKYFEEYNKSDLDEKGSIRQLILMNFAEFDESKLQNEKLKQFLIRMRGY